MLLMIENCIRGGTCQFFHQYAKADNKYMKNYDKIKESLYLKYQDVNNSYRWAMSKNMPVTGLKWVKNTS